MDKERDEQRDAPVIRLHPDPSEDTDELEREALDEAGDEGDAVDDNVIPLDRGDPPNTVA